MILMKAMYGTFGADWLVTAETKVCQLLLGVIRTGILQLICAFFRIWWIWRLGDRRRSIVLGWVSGLIKIFCVMFSWLFDRIIYFSPRFELIFVISSQLAPRFNYILLFLRVWWPSPSYLSLFLWLDLIINSLKFDNARAIKLSFLSTFGTSINLDG